MNDGSMTDIEINDPEELMALLARAYWMEAELEVSTEWEAYIETWKGYKEILFQITHDSEQHKLYLKKVIRNVDGMDIQAHLEGKSKKNFDFREMEPVDMLKEIVKYDYAAVDLYQKLHDCVSRQMLERIWLGDVVDDFYSVMKWLVGQEEMHVELLESHIGKP
jgi:hypothetical protein